MNSVEESWFSGPVFISPCVSLERGKNYKNDKNS